MQITIRYETLLKRATGLAAQKLEITDDCDVREVIARLAQDAVDVVKPMLVDTSGSVQPSLLIFVNDRQIPVSEACPVSAGDEVTLMSPISGG